MTSLMLAAVIQISVIAAPQQDTNEDYRRAYRRSVTTGRPLVVLIGADWCSACRTMKTSVLPRVAKIGGLDRVEFTYVDLDRQRDLASRLVHGKSIPQLVRFTKTGTGWKSAYLVGRKDAREVYYFINPGLAHGKNSNNLSTMRDPWWKSLFYRR